MPRAATAWRRDVIAPAYFRPDDRSTYMLFEPRRERALKDSFPRPVLQQLDAGHASRAPRARSRAGSRCAAMDLPEAVGVERTYNFVGE